jgi:arsenite methyltransferase
MARSTTHHVTGPVRVDPADQRADVQANCRQVGRHPDAGFHFHTGRDLELRCRYDFCRRGRPAPLAVESFAGVANPFELRQCHGGPGRSAPLGRVIGVDMTPEMLATARTNAHVLHLANVEFRAGLAESLPVEDGWAEVVIPNGVFNLCADKRAVYDEVMRVLRPGGVLQSADIAEGRPVPEEAPRQLDLWTG